MSSNAPKIRLCQLWQRKSSKGEVYFSGFIAGARIVILRDHRATEEGEMPEGCQAIWSVLLEQAEDRKARPTSANEQWTNDFGAPEETQPRPGPRLVSNGGGDPP